MLLISTHIDTNFWGNFNQNYHVNWWKDHTHNTCHALSNQNDALECFENNYIQRDIYEHNYAVNPLPANFYYCAIDRNDEIINSN